MVRRPKGERYHRPREMPSLQNHLHSNPVMKAQTRPQKLSILERDRGGSSLRVQILLPPVCHDRILPMFPEKMALHLPRQEEMSLLREIPLHTTTFLEEQHDLKRQEPRHSSHLHLREQPRLLRSQHHRHLTFRGHSAHRPNMETLSGIAIVSVRRMQHQAERKHTFPVPVSADLQVLVLPRLLPSLLVGFRQMWRVPFHQAPMVDIEARAHR